MRINNIKINSYGNIQNKEMNFTNGINIVKGKNESGKSTLLSYIVNIFYGISKNKEGRAFSDYDKYKPWTGNEFSGRIEYNLDSGEKFEVFRDFNKKNPKIYNDKYEDISDKYNINKKDGNQFFNMQTNIDKQMYISTVVSMQQDVRLDEKNQNMLVQKIANLAGTGEDNVSYKKAITKLQEKIRDEVGTNKTSLKPINIAKNELNNIEIELNKIKPYEAKKYDIDTEKEKIKSDIELLETKKEIAIKTKKIYEEQNSIIQKLEIKENNKKENIANLDALYNREKQYETNQDNILHNIEEANELKTIKTAELENLIKSEEELNNEENTNIQPTKNTIYIILEAILAIFLIVNLVSIKEELVSLSITLGMIIVFLVYLFKALKEKRNNKKILENKQLQKRKSVIYINEQKETLQRKIEEINNDIENIKLEQDKNNNELSMVKGQIALLNKKFNDDKIEIEELNKNLDDNTEKCKQELYVLYNDKINKNEIENIVEAEDIYNKLLEIENELSNNKLKLRTLEIEEKNILPQLDNMVTLKEKQSAIKERIEELKKQEKIINIALENLQEAYEEMKTTITPKFTQNLSNNVSKISNGKYTKVTISDEKGMIVENKKGEYIEADKLSVGTIDQLYLSLRLSMIDELSEEKLPIMLDETFAYFDEERIKNAIEYILNELHNHQTIIFTCSNREIEILEKMNIEYNLIEL